MTACHPQAPGLPYPGSLRLESPCLVPATWPACTARQPSRCRWSPPGPGKRENITLGHLLLLNRVLSSGEKNKSREEFSTAPLIMRAAAWEQETPRLASRLRARPAPRLLSVPGGAAFHCVHSNACWLVASLAMMHPSEGRRQAAATVSAGDAPTRRWTQDRPVSVPGG